MGYKVEDGVRNVPLFSVFFQVLPNMNIQEIYGQNGKCPYISVYDQMTYTDMSCFFGFCLKDRNCI